MPAWNDSQQQWGAATYGGYKKYVTDNAPHYKGSTEDCSKLSIKLIIDYAAANGLPVSFWSMFDVLYSSRALHQWPEHWPPDSLPLEWKSKDTFYKAILRRIDSTSLLKKNTTPVTADVWPGDLMLKEDHTALVFEMWDPGEDHALLQRADIPDFPGPETAAHDLNQLDYFRTPRLVTKGIRSVSPVEKTKAHIDYLNHRGEAFPKNAPVKQKAELIYYADAQDMVTTQKLGFRRFGSHTVLNNWLGWDGSVPPPR